MLDGISKEAAVAAVDEAALKLRPIVETAIEGLIESGKAALTEVLDGLTITITIQKKQP